MSKRQLRRLAVATAAVAAGALVGPAGHADVKPAPPQSDYKVCSPLGCAQQHTSGTITWGATLTTVKGQAHDSAPGTAAIVRVEQFAGAGPIGVFQIVVDDETVSYAVTGAPNLRAVRVTICAGSLVRCNSTTVPNPVHTTS
jgi:hypothetical protein